MKQNEHFEVARTGPDLRTTLVKTLAVVCDHRHVGSMVTVTGCLAREAKTMRADAAHGPMCIIQKKTLQNNEVQIDVRIGFASSPCESRLTFGVISWSGVDVASALILHAKNDVAEVSTSELHSEPERKNSDDINNDCNVEHKRTSKATVLHDLQ